MRTPFIDLIRPATRNGSFRLPGFWVWGASPIFGDDGRYHLFASRWTKDVGFTNWVTNSEIVRAAADRPEGPYTFEEVVLGARSSDFWDGQTTHNPTIHRHPDGTYLLFYTGTTYRGPRPNSQVGTGPVTSQWAEAWNQKRIGLATANSIMGPWQRPDVPLLDPRPGEWDSVITSNPAPCVQPDGRIVLIYKSTDIRHPEGPFPGRFHLGATAAANWATPFQRLATSPITIGTHPDHHVEDGYVWWNGNAFEMIAKDMTGEICGEVQAGIHATSLDAVHWKLANPSKAYSRTVRWDDGTTSTQAKLERPQLLIENGRPTHLFTATLIKDADNRITDSWNCVLPLASDPAN